MSRVFISEGTGVGIYVFSDDHCPAHVHARHRGEGWIARVRFSYLGSKVELIITTRSESPLERCSSTTARLSARLVVDAKNDMFGEPVGPFAWTWQDRASLVTRSGCETNR